MKRSIVAAYAKNLVPGRGYPIGKNGDIPWSFKEFSEDMKRFRHLTTGNPVIMGRKTFFESVKKPLPKRTNIVVTRNPELQITGALTANSLEEAIHLCERGDLPMKDGIYIIGGQQIYEQTLSMVDNLYLTVIDKEVPFPDAFFPEISPSEWRCKELTSKGNCKFATYKRK